MEIVLVRHGKPEGAVNPIVDSPGFAEWVRRYNKLGLRPDSRPPAVLMSALSESLVVSSDLARARESAERFAGRPPDRVLPVGAPEQSKRGCLVDHDGTGVRCDESS